MIWIMTLLILVILCQQCMLYQERQNLLNRIQAGRFVEFKKFEDKPKKKEEKKEEKPNEYGNLLQGE